MKLVFKTKPKHLSLSDGPKALSTKIASKNLVSISGMPSLEYWCVSSRILGIVFPYLSFRVCDRAIELTTTRLLTRQEIESPS